MQMNVPALAQMHDDSGMAGFRERILRQNGELVYRIVRFVTVYRTKYALTGREPRALPCWLRLHHRNRKYAAQPVGLTLCKVEPQQIFTRTAGNTQRWQMLIVDILDKACQLLRAAAPAN